MRDFFQDVRLAFRSFVQAPGFTVVAVLSLGLGIGSMSTIYLWTDRFILNPLPTVPGGDELTFVRTRGPEDAIYSISYPTFRDWSERNRAFEGLAVMTLERVGVRERDGEAVERAFALLVSGNYFDVMQVRALHGRTFYPDEDSSAAQVAVLGHDYWQRRFRGDPGIVGRGIVINGQRVEVVGVMPPRFGGSYVGLDLDLYLPVSNYRALNLGRSRLDDRGSMFLEGIGRRKPGISLADAQADMERVGRELDADLPEASNHAVVEPLDGQGAPSTMKPIFFALLGVTALVLLIACANVANLLLARAGSREREIAVRAAIGAGRLRLIRQLLTESVLLALGGATVGLFLAYLGRGALVEMLPPAPFPVDFRFDMNYRVVGFGLVAALGTVLLFGVWPAFRATRPDLAPVLRSLPSGSIAKSAARSVLVGGQMALAVVALVSAGLFLRAIDRSRRSEE
ncbi:MAG: ABC transporter permease, partial [Gemmatimonadales bacterium]